MKKKVFKYFTIAQYEAEEEYLRLMHKSGWKFVKVSGFGIYNFEQCEPQDVVYKLDYNQEGIKHKNEYVQMFNDCGWEYMQDYVGYSYFRKPASEENGNDDIFCDDESRLEMMSRVFKGRLVPLLILFLAVLIPQFALSIYNNHTGIATVYGIILGLYIAIFFWFATEYKKYKNNIKK